MATKNVLFIGICPGKDRSSAPLRCWKGITRPYLCQ